MFNWNIRLYSSYLFKNTLRINQIWLQSFIYNFKKNQFNVTKFSDFQVLCAIWLLIRSHIFFVSSIAFIVYRISKYGSSASLYFVQVQVALLHIIVVNFRENKVSICLKVSENILLSIHFKYPKINNVLKGGFHINIHFKVIKYYFKF